MNCNGLVTRNTTRFIFCCIQGNGQLEDIRRQTLVYSPYQQGAEVKAEVLHVTSAVTEAFGLVIVSLYFAVLQRSTTQRKGKRVFVAKDDVFHCDLQLFKAGNHAETRSINNYKLIFQRSERLCGAFADCCSTEFRLHEISPPNSV